MATEPSTPASVASLLARAEHEPDLALTLAQLAGAAAAATRAVLLQMEAGTRRLRPLGAGAQRAMADDVWITTGDASALVTELFAAGRIRQLRLDAEAPAELSTRLGTPAAILAPIIYAGHPIGLLVLGVPGVVPALEWAARVSECADAIAVTMMGALLRHEAFRQQALLDLVVALGRSGSPTIPVDRFEAFCGDIARVMGATGVEFWQFDRQGRKMDRVVSSLPGGDESVTTAASLADTARLVGNALREQRPAVVRPSGADADRGATVTVPMQGRRRAIGVLLLVGLRVPAGGETRTLDVLEGLGHQLANVIESSNLLSDILRTRHELEDTFDSMRDLVIVCGSDGRITHVNRALIRRVNRLRTDLVGQPITTLVGQPLIAWLTSNEASSVDGTATRTIELEDPALGGTFLITVTPLADKDPGQPGLVIVARDVSEERRLGAERAALRDRLARSEAMGQLVAGIAHELNNPLQAVLGHIELLQRSHRLPAQLAGGLRQVYRESDRAARIVRNLLLLAGSGQVHKRPLSVNAAMRQAIALRAAALKSARIRVIRTLPATVPKVSGDALLLQQAFLNLLINAEQALEGKPGQVEVRSSYSAKRRQVAIEVRDSGSGISPDVLPKVFDPFFTTKESGSGLGLAMAMRIIREHGGEITATARPGGGAVFTVTLPATLAAKR